MEKLDEVFATFASTEFCSHLTLGLTEYANESLHNVIRNLIPRSKYSSPASIYISVAFAVLTFSEGAIALYQLLSDLGLNPSPSTFAYLAHHNIDRHSKVRVQRDSNFKRRRR